LETSQSYISIFIIRLSILLLNIENRNRKDIENRKDIKWID